LHPTFVPASPWTAAESPLHALEAAIFLGRYRILPKAGVEHLDEL
jgi:hypothetical protein